MFAHDLNSEHRKDTVDLWNRGDYRRYGCFVPPSIHKIIERGDFYG